LNKKVKRFFTFMTSAIVEMPASEAMDYSNATAAAAALTSLLSAAAEKQW